MQRLEKALDEAVFLRLEKQNAKDFRRKTRAEKKRNVKEKLIISEEKIEKEESDKKV